MLKNFWQRDSMALGALLGLITPLITYLVIELIDKVAYQIVVSRSGPTALYSIIPDDTQFALAVAGNLFFFQRFMVKFKKDRTGRGILLLTFAWAAAYIILFFMLEVKRIPLF